MISAEILKSAGPENVKSLWPGIVDIEEARVWDKVCRAGRLRFVAAGACEKGERPKGDLEEEWDYASGEEDDFVVRVLEEVVKGRLASDDPSFFLRAGPGLVLVWPFLAP